jgi:hypothetical protein
MKGHITVCIAKRADGEFETCFSILGSVDCCVFYFIF